MQSLRKTGRNSRFRMSIDVSRGIEVSSFTKVYGKGDRARTACSKVDFSAHAGQIVGILGPNGAGKSTLLKALCGVHYPTEGSVCVCGTDDANEIRRIVGYVPEFPELDRHLTVAETLYMEAYVHGLEQNEIAEGMKKALSIADLEEVADQKVGTLSKGYAQRTAPETGAGRPSSPVRYASPVQTIPMNAPTKGRNRVMSGRASSSQT